nr:hypothetical protein CFP56_16757 [Quercus suber]
MTDTLHRISGRRESTTSWHQGSSGHPSTASCLDARMTRRARAKASELDVDDDPDEQSRSTSGDLFTAKRVAQIENHNPSAGRTGDGQGSMPSPSFGELGEAPAFAAASSENGNERCTVAESTIDRGQLYCPQQKLKHSHYPSFAPLASSLLRPQSDQPVSSSTTPSWTCIRDAIIAQQLPTPRQ